MKARKHCGGFAESMETLKEIPATFESVSQYFETPKSCLQITPYSFDGRDNWNSETWLVSSKGGVLGMISQEVKA